tara:strand:- start:506 stop:1003 length:498 start_codon:yes stop_codon:yes gene_type:complete
MQAYVEIILVAILVVILFNGSITGLKDFANSVLGKAVMVCLIIAVSHQFGTNAGLLMAAITVVLLNQNLEGFEEMEDTEEEEEGDAMPTVEDAMPTESFSNYTLDNAADYTNLQSTLKAYTTNDNIMTSMRASEYAKTAPGGTALMTNHIDTMKVVNNPRSEGIF